MAAKFDQQRFQSLLPNWFLHYYQETDSTNRQARLAVERGEAVSGSVFLADRQTDGVGRRGSPWLSKANENLLFTAVVETGMASAISGMVAIAAGLSVARQLQPYCDRVGLKWPNDIYIGGRKVAGILVEQVGDFSLVGIGINVYASDFPTDLKATSLVLSGGLNVLRENLLACILTDLVGSLSLCQSDFNQVVNQVSPFDLLRGKEISYKTNGISCHARAIGIEPDGSLLVYQSGREFCLTSASEIRLLPF